MPNPMPNPNDAGEFQTRGLPDPDAEPVNPIYQRQAALDLTTPSVVIVGCGGVGCWVALSLVLGGVSYLQLFDGDTLSLHNLNRFPLSPANVGELKSVALARWLSTLRKDAEIIARGEYDPLIHKVDTYSWIVCATDSLKSRQMCYQVAKRDGLNYLEVGADGERWTLSPAPPEFSTEDEAAAGYSSVPVHVGPCMMAGAAAAYYVLHNSQPTGTHAMTWDPTSMILSGKWISDVEVWDDAKGEICLAEDEGDGYESGYPSEEEEEEELENEQES